MWVGGFLNLVADAHAADPFFSKNIVFPGFWGPREPRGWIWLDLGLNLRHISSTLELWASSSTLPLVAFYWSALHDRS